MRNNAQQILTKENHVEGIINKSFDVEKNSITNIKNINIASGANIDSDKLDQNLTDKNIRANLIAVNDGSQLTISSGSITITKGYHKIYTEGGASSDDLDTINGGSYDGQILILVARFHTKTVVVKNGTGNLYIGADFSLDSDVDTIVLMYFSGYSAWVCLAKQSNG